MNPWVIIGLIVFWLFSLLGAEQYGDHARGTKDALKMAQQRDAEATAIMNAQSENDTLKTQLGVQHEQANNALNVLLSMPAPRVRIPTCRQTGQAYTAPGSSVPATSPERTSDETQIAFDAFRQGLESDAAEWSRALNACQVVMEWTKAQ